MSKTSGVNKHSTIQNPKNSTAPNSNSANVNTCFIGVYLLFISSDTSYHYSVGYCKKIAWQHNNYDCREILKTWWSTTFSCYGDLAADLKRKGAPFGKQITIQTGLGWHTKGVLNNWGNPEWPWCHQHTVQPWVCRMLSTFCFNVVLIRESWYIHCSSRKFCQMFYIPHRELLCMQIKSPSFKIQTGQGTFCFLNIIMKKKTKRKKECTFLSESTHKPRNIFPSCPRSGM